VMMSAALPTAGLNERGHRDRRLGRVVSDKGDKTIGVLFEFTVKHPKYGKYFKRSTKLHAHDEENRAKVGDWVEVVACRRMSKNKCWRLTRIIERRGTMEPVELGIELPAV